MKSIKYHRVRNLISPGLIFFLGLSSSIIKGQTTVLRQLDTTAINHWPMVMGGAVSNDGNYAGYVTAQSAAFPYSHPFSAAIKSLHSDWSVPIDSVQGENIRFSADSRYAICMLPGNRLLLQPTGSLHKIIIDDIDQFECASIGNTEYLVYQRKSNKNLVIRSFKTGREIMYPAVLSYLYNPAQGSLFLISKAQNSFLLQELPLNTEKLQVLYTSETEISSLKTDAAGTHLTFKDATGRLFAFDKTKNAIVDLNNLLPDSIEGLKLKGIERFEGNGRLLIVRYDRELAPLNPSVNPVKVFSYQDEEYFDAKQVGERSPDSYLFAYDLEKNKLTRLEFENDNLRRVSDDGKLALIAHVNAFPAEYYWNKTARHTDYVLSIETGKKIVSDFVLGAKMSSDGHWIIGQNDQGGDIFSINILTGQKVNLTASLPTPAHETSTWGGEQPEDKNSRGFLFYNWSKDGKSIIVYDRFDIWQLDLSGRHTPICLTNENGRKNNIVYRFIANGPELQIATGDDLIITAFNNETKDNGFYRLVIGKPESLRKLTMGPYLYQADEQLVPNWAPPVKARNADVWLIPRQSANASRNFFWTKDFQTFHSISNVYPEKDYEWFTTELINFTTKDGVACKAILYKPQNFDSTKEYPVLFNYYQAEETDKLNSYRFPAFTDQYYFNFPMMLARGYLVCLTDTHQQTIGETAHCLVDAIEGAADALAKRPYIDSKHFGASGGSFGGYATNCLAALSNKFAAVVPISGPSDLFSAYANFPGLAEEEVENRQFGMGVSLGTDPERYLRNSPIAYTKKVSTPVLIVNTIMDHNVNIQQGIEWFISLRREGKRAWMLQYQEDSHGVGKLEDQCDLYTRMNQFFDHYLKGAPAPVWMTKGISINDTGVKDGFEYDTKIKTPEPSHLSETGSPAIN